MSRIRRLVLDTSTLVSAALRSGSVPHQTLLKALAFCDVCASVETLNELQLVLDRSKFDRYLDRESRRAFVALIRQNVHLFVVQASETAAVQPPCRALQAAEKPHGGGKKCQGTTSVVPITPTKSTWL